MSSPYSVLGSDKLYDPGSAYLEAIPVGVIARPFRRTGLGEVRELLRLEDVGGGPIPIELRLGMDGVAVGVVVRLELAEDTYPLLGVATDLVGDSVPDETVLGNDPDVTHGGL